MIYSQSITSWKHLAVQLSVILLPRNTSADLHTNLSKCFLDRHTKILLLKIFYRMAVSITTLDCNLIVMYKCTPTLAPPSASFPYFTLYGSYFTMTTRDFKRKINKLHFATIHLTY